MIATCRQAVREDIPEIQRVRHSVNENRLTSGVITDDDVRDAIERTGRGWVVDLDGGVAGFAIGNAETGNIWALFVDPKHEGNGYGRKLHDEMVQWLWSRGLSKLWLSTTAQTRAQRFYEAAGWVNAGVLASGEILFEMHSFARSADALAYTVHDDLPHEESRAVDEGLGAANDIAAPLVEVRPLSCFARATDMGIVGGAVGRTWGPCCELQQLWVDSAFRRKGIASRLIREFESRARSRGCRTFYLETFSFQTPELYRSLGYEVKYPHAVYPHGIVKYVMVREE